MRILSHEIGNSCSQHLVNLLVPVEWISEINNAVKQHHVRTSINSAFAHHQILLGEFADQGTVCVHNRQATDVVITDQLDGILKGRFRHHTENRLGHHIGHRQLEDHGVESSASILRCDWPGG